MTKSSALVVKPSAVPSAAPAFQTLSISRVPRLATPPRGDSTGSEEKVALREWRLTARNPPNCCCCRGPVNPEHMEILVDRKVWVLCGKRCRLQWESDHSSTSSLDPLVRKEAVK